MAVLMILIVPIQEHEIAFQEIVYLKAQSVVPTVVQWVENPTAVAQVAAEMQVLSWHSAVG